MEYKAGWPVVLDGGNGLEQGDVASDRELWKLSMDVHRGVTGATSRRTLGSRLALPTSGMRW